MKSGKHLIDLGFKPNRLFKEAIEYINKNNLSDEEIISYCNNLFPKEILPHEKPFDYSVFITATTDEEKENLKATMETMSEVMKTPVVLDGAIMPDACPSGIVGNIPVGGVVVTDNAVIPSMHSADICCSLMLSHIDTLSTLDDILNVSKEVTHFGYGVNPLFEGKLSNDLIGRIYKNKITREFIDSALKSFGTQGDGNHFLSVGTSQREKYKTIVTHHGSRSFGANVYKKGVKIAEKFRRQISPNTNPINAWIPLDTEEGQTYWEALQLVREWTKENHFIIHSKIVELLGNSFIEVNYWNEHNFVFKRDNLVYHAKGSTPMTDDFTHDNYMGLRIIPMNMADDILIVKPHIENKIGFAPHGAGRNMSRRKFSKTANIGELNKSVENIKFIPYSGTIDYSEFPSAYKNSKQVEEDLEKFKLATVFDRIKPYGCIMAGEQEKFWIK